MTSYSLTDGYSTPEDILLDRPAIFRLSPSSSFKKELLEKLIAQHENLERSVQLRRRRIRSIMLGATLSGLAVVTAIGVLMGIKLRQPGNREIN